MSAHYIYRCYDAAGALLYVGCTDNVKRRMSQHAMGRSRASRVLRALMASHTTEGPFVSRDAAEAAEQAAIRAGSPLLNIAHGNLTGWLADRRLEAYLTKRGLPLAVGGLHRCSNCDVLLGHHVEVGMCVDCREDLAFRAEFATQKRASA